MTERIPYDYEPPMTRHEELLWRIITRTTLFETYTGQLLLPLPMYLETDLADLVEKTLVHMQKKNGAAPWNVVMHPDVYKQIQELGVERHEGESERSTAPPGKGPYRYQ